jgi:DNA (cytosine-5)-methyltransferase 1
LILSLFCGAGGLDYGFEIENFKVSLAFDLRPAAINTYNHNHPGRHGYVADISKLTIDDLDKIYGREFQPYGVIGGPPCQSFSFSNVSEKENDKRHDLPLKYAELLKSLNARNPIHFFVFENVLGLKSKKHIEKFKRFKAAFEDAGFNIHEKVLDSVDFGVPQNRKRIFIVGLNKQIYPDCSMLFPTHKTKRKTVSQSISKLPDPIFFSSRNNFDSIPFHPNHWCMTPKSKKFSTPGVLIPGKAIGRSFRVLEWNKPSPTVAYGNREVHVHPSCHRRLSVFEAMLLQGFPKKFELKGTLSDQFSQVSEAVPPPLSREVAKTIRFICGLT